VGIIDFVHFLARWLRKSVNQDLIAPCESRSCRIDPLCLLAEWCKTCLNQVLVSFGLFCVYVCSFFYPNLTTLRSVFGIAILSVSRRLSSITFVHPIQPVEIFRNASTPFCNLPIRRPPCKSLRRSSQENTSDGVKRKRGSQIQPRWTCRRLYLGNGARCGLGYN